MLISLLTRLPVAHSVSSLGRQLVGWLGVAGLVGNSVYRRRIAERQWKQEQRLRREAMAYLTLDLPLGRLERSHFARLMSRTIATRSSFARAALLLQDSSGSMTVAGSAGMDDGSVAALNRWGAEAAASLHPEVKAGPVFGRRVGSCSFAVQLERRSAGAACDPLAKLGCARVHVTPIASAAGLLAVIVVCAEPRPTLHAATTGAHLQLLLEPIEALALRLSTQLSEVPRALPSGRVRAATVRTRERLPDRRRARGPQLPHDGRTTDSLADTSRKTQRQMPPFLVPKAVLTPYSPAGVATGFPSARLWHMSHPNAEIPSAQGPWAIPCPAE